MPAGIDFRTAPGTSCDSFSPNDDNLVYLPNGKFPRAFIPDADGTLAVIAAEDEGETNATSIPVKGGLQYNLSCRKFLATGTSGVTAIVGIG